MSSVNEQALDAADGLIEDVKNATGHDYSKHREAIASQLYESGIWQGYWDSSTDLEDENLPDLRLIQEDEYDQHMDDGDEKTPTRGDMVCQTEDGYVWFC